MASTWRSVLRRQTVTTSWVRLLFLVGLLLLAACGSGGGGDPTPPGGGSKFDRWLQPSAFRGFDVGYYNYGSGAKTLADFQALAATGATLAQIQTNEGTRQWAAPYGANQDGIDSLDAMIGFCGQAGLDYVIAVREGPGRQTVDEEAADTIWTNAAEQQLYADMLRDDIAAQYASDPRCVGINVMVEPNPLNAQVADGTIGTPGEYATALAAQGIDVNAMMALFITEIRKVNPTIPVIVQAVGWSDPAWWGLLQKQADPYVVYDFHTYAPRDYTHPACGAPGCGGLAYPGTYEMVTWNRSYLEGTYFAEVIQFQDTHQVPILMGEFGMQFAQTGGVQFLSDHVDIALARGWHFCVWNYRSDTQAPGTLDFDYEKWGAAYWNEVLGWFP